jgi:hypothetical protein
MNKKWICKNCDDDIGDNGHSEAFYSGQRNVAKQMRHDGKYSHCYSLARPMTPVALTF